MDNKLKLNIRMATPDDAAALLAIYAPYITDTAITFEYTIPSLEEFRSRIENTLKTYPYLVAEADGEIAGYAYVGEFHGREAYLHSVETSIYVAADKKGCGIGSALYAELEKRLIAQRVYIFHACIAYTDDENDPYLTNDSETFHAHLGYTNSGKHYHCAYKFDRWYSIIWMEKVIEERPAHPEPFIPLSAM